MELFLVIAHYQSAVCAVQQTQKIKAAPTWKTVWKIEVGKIEFQMKSKDTPFNFSLAIFIPSFPYKSLAAGAKCLAMPLELLFSLAPCEPDVCKVCLVHDAH